VIERGQGRLRVALPWLEAALGAAAAAGRTSARAPAAEWLVARGRAKPVAELPWREWLLAPTGVGRELLRRCPAGPSVRAARAAGPPVGTWACARPVHLVTAIEHLRLAPEGVDLGAEESSVLLDDINRHLDGRGFRLQAHAPGEDWLLECVEPIDCSSVEPEDAAGRSVRELMPAGRDGARVRSLMNEIQMLLHAHPVNLDRAARGRAAINTLWIWGFGRHEDSGAMSLPMLYTDDAWLAGIWRLHGASSRSLDEFPVSQAVDGDPIMVTGSRSVGGTGSGTGLGDALAGAERRVLAPARAALRSGVVGGVDVLLGGHAIAVEPRARFMVWRRGRPIMEALP
jgi:hypothetical protein